MSSLRTGPEAQLQQVGDRCSIENSWHWPRDTQLMEDAHRYRVCNGVQNMATLRSLDALAHDVSGITGLRRE